MAKAPAYNSRGTASIAASTTLYPLIVVGLVNGSANPATESSGQITFRSATTLSGLYIRVTSNDRGASTFTLRKNLGAGNQTLSIGASATGEFEDAVNTDSISAGDEVNAELITGAGGTTFVNRVFRILHNADTNTTVRIGSTNTSANFSTASVQNFITVFSDVTTGEINENNNEFSARTAATLSNYFLNVTSNGRSTTTSSRMRINNANGNMTVSVTASATGFFEDTSNTDTLASGDEFNTDVVTGTGTGAFGVTGPVFDFTTTNSTFHTACAKNAGTAQNQNVTRYYPMGGFIVSNGDTTESDVQIDAGVAFTSSNLQAYISLNSITAASTIRTRVDTANGNQSVSVGSTATGFFEDTTNTDSITASSAINFQVVTGSAASTSMTIRNIGILGTIAAAAGTYISKMPLMGVS